MGVLRCLRYRLKEPVAYAGIGVVAVALFGAQAKGYIDALAQVGLGAAGLLAIVLPEGGVK